MALHRADEWHTERPAELDRLQVNADHIAIILVQLQHPLTDWLIATRCLVEKDFNDFWVLLPHRGIMSQVYHIWYTHSEQNNSYVSSVLEFWY